MSRAPAAVDLVLSPRQVVRIMSMSKCFLRVLSLVALLGGCAPSGPDVGLGEQEIVDGTRETATGSPAVVLLYNNRIGSLCTATIISPRVVLTARHCIASESGAVQSPSNISLYVGTSERSITMEYRASEILVIPGSTGDIQNGRAEDVALIVLASPARETPMEISRLSPNRIVGTEITAIGFGQTPTGGAGTKYRTTANVEGYQQGLIFVDPAVCSGDSGGPVIGPDGLIYGVASFIFSADGRTEPTCGTAPGAYNEIYRHIEWIDSVLESVGDRCTPSAEICDGLDNDCNEMVDEGCSPLGSECTDSSTCIGGLCATTITGQRCTQACDPGRPALGCPPGFYCGADGCAGHCVMGSVGAASIGASCAVDTDCASLFCSDPGDGMQRCLQPCRLDAGRCLGGEICLPTGDQCGGCVDEGIVSGLAHGLGEPCGGDVDCRSGMCRDSDGVRECVAPCGEGCIAGFVCEADACVRDRAQGIGGPCVDNGDCGAAGICATLGDRRWCTATCAAPSECPAGFSCTDAGGVSVCAPDRALEGEGCGANEECVTGLCAFDGGEGRCTAFCDADSTCGAGFECRRTFDGASAVCVRPGATSGGCTVALGGRPARGWLALPALALLALVLRRRR